ncbi:hypothetical protein TKK_0016913 [Trichogramma kaykai]|uniref:[histone H3]-dimethyl-L-lysine(36) demethylase n=1 Tax=Trichogramma kaykai TaxID=54128 RepID=A0ABD2W5F2_9HYME
MADSGKMQGIDTSAANATMNNQPVKRRLRERTKKFYTDDWAFGDEELEGRRGFLVEEKIESDKYNLKNFNGLYREMTGEELTVSYFQKHGFGIPLLIKDKAGLGIRVPSSNFNVHDVRTCVGSRRLLDVMDVNTQKNEEMTMKEWQKYYEEEERTRLLNVISLEFSHTKLENYVQSPTIVRQVDWVSSVWPKHLKEQQVEATNLLEDMMYPKVQKYCLMSVKGCYTDFHVDFGGTSVWYHILKGAKIFWLIPPTEKNLARYQQWVLSGKQSDVFFGDMVDKCGRITLSAGMTMFIPTGWIHAVYTPADSLVFGGNFLHSYGIDKQLKIAQVEEATKVPHKFRYPFFTEMLWYVLERYVHVLLGRSHLDISEDQSHHLTPKHTKHVHLTSMELHGLKSIVMYLHALPSTKKNVPELIKDPIALIHDVRCLVEQHRHDSPDEAVTGLPVLPPPPILTSVEREKLGMGRPRKYPRSSGEHKSTGPRRRRTRCKKCEACTRADCAECVYCLDMVKFGGSGRAKQTCMMRQCLRPMLPVTASCKFCGLDGWGQTPAPLMGKQAPTAESNLMECSICYEIVHPDCTGKDVQNMSISDDIPNSWECPTCCESGRNLESKQRAPKGRPRKSNASPSSSRNSPVESEPSNKIQKLMSNEDDKNGQEISDEEPKMDYQNELANNHTEKTNKHNNTSPINSNSHNNHQEQKTPPPQWHQQNQQQNQQPHQTNSPQQRQSPKKLPTVSPNQKKETLEKPGWPKSPRDANPWRTMDLSNNTLSATHLSNIIQHQPETLLLDWTNVAKKQLAWLLSRLSPLRNLSLKGCNWAGVCALNTSACPPLVSLDLDFVAGFNDSSLREILSPPSDSRPGLIDKTSRLKNLRNLSLKGCDISDISMRYIAQHLTNLESLDLSTCSRITDAGIAQITSPPATTVTTLVSLKLNGCRLLTDLSLDHLLRCQSLKNLDLRNTTQFSVQKVNEYSKSARLNNLIMDPRPEYENRRAT